MSKDLVIHHNALDFAIYKMTPVELKLMHYCITKVRRDGGYDDSNRHFEISHSDFARGLGRDRCYDDMQAAAMRLQQRIVIINETIVDKDGQEWDGGAISVLSAQKWREGEGIIRLSFSPEFMPYLTNLSGNFNKLFYKEIATLYSTYSIRMYKRLRSHFNIIQSQKIKQRLVISVHELKSIFALGEKYKKHNDFKRKVIDRAVDEINSAQHLPFSVDIAQVKRGRRIEAYSFGTIAKEQEKLGDGQTKTQKKLEKFVRGVIKAFNDGKQVAIKGKNVESTIGDFAVVVEGATYNLFALLKDKPKLKDEIKVEQSEELFK